MLMGEGGGRYITCGKSEQGVNIAPNIIQGMEPSSRLAYNLGKEPHPQTMITLRDSGGRYI